jgi:hypothetical protein
LVPNATQSVAGTAGTVNGVTVVLFMKSFATVPCAIRTDAAIHTVALYSIARIVGAIMRGFYCRAFVSCIQRVATKRQGVYVAHEIQRHDHSVNKCQNKAVY